MLANLIQKRFDKYFVRSDTEDCWEWNGAVSKGIGMFRYDDRMQPAARVAWMLFHGDIPSGLHVCHTCDNPKCVNLSHLFLGTRSDNMRDKINKGRGNNPQGERHYNAKITSDIALDIRYSSLPVKELSLKYGISLSHAYEIRNGRKWRNASSTRA